MQHNGYIAYEADPAANLLRLRWDAEYFADFSGLWGLVPDVGCGPQAVSPFGLDFDGKLIGVDPLFGVQLGTFDLAQGIGGHLPMPRASLGRVLFAKCLAHTSVPVSTLAPARTIVGPVGVASVSVAADHHEDGRTNPWWRRVRSPRPQSYEG